MLSLKEEKFGVDGVCLDFTVCIVNGCLSFHLRISLSNTLSYARVTDVITCCFVVFVLMSTGEMVIRNSILNPQEIRKHTLKLAFSVLHTNTALTQRH